MIYVLVGNQLYEFPQAEIAKVSGNGHLVHVIEDGDHIVANFPLKAVRYFGSQRPPEPTKFIDYDERKPTD